MTSGTINADETYRGYTITQDHADDFWYISSPSQTDSGGNELYGKFSSRAELKDAIDKAVG